MWYSGNRWVVLVRDIEMSHNMMHNLNEIVEISKYLVPLLELANT